MASTSSYKAPAKGTVDTYFRMGGKELKALAADGDKAAKREIARRKANRAAKKS